MLAKLTRLAVVVTLLCTVGAHWTILQSVAWMRMAVAFSQDASLGEALVKTFDGKHPCDLCKLVQQGKRSEQRQDSQKSQSKIDVFLVSGQESTAAPVVEPLPRLSDRLPDLSSQPPPSPPPRRLPG